MIEADEIYNQLNLHVPNNRVIAYSGGLDSHVLLHLLAQFKDGSYPVRATHIDHGLQKDSKSWAHHCNNVCAQLGVDFELITLDLVIPKGKSLEEIARAERYKALYQSLEPNESLLTAHHKNDQVETFLLNLFRGAGVDGLASMPVSRMFGPMGRGRQLFRPLLSYSRESLESYARHHGLRVIEDPSNADQSYDRNFLRNQIIPEISKRWTGLEKSICRAASIQSEAKEILEEVASAELQKVYDANNNTVSIYKLQELTKAKQKLVLRHWIAKLGFSYPSETKLQHLFSDVINAGEDMQPLLEWSGVQIRRYRGKLYIMEPLQEHDPGVEIVWDGKTPLKITSLKLTINPEEVPVSADKITVRFRQGGEKIEIANRGHLSLKNLFQEQGVPPWMRDRMPLLYIDNELVKVIGVQLESR